MNIVIVENLFNGARTWNNHIKFFNFEDDYGGLSSQSIKICAFAYQSLCPPTVKHNQPQFCSQIGEYLLIKSPFQNMIRVHAKI